MTILQNKLSLTKKLEGGYIHVKKNKSPSKKKYKKGYAKYLHKINDSSKQSDSSKQVMKPSSKKKISIKSRSRSRSKRRRKKSNPLLDVKPKSLIVKNKYSAPASVPVKSSAPASVPVKSSAPASVPAKSSAPASVPVKSSAPAPKKSSGKYSLTSKKKRKSSKKKYRTGKRISVTKSRITNKDIDSIQSKIKSIREKTTEEIKKELDKQGIKVTGKSPSILKDIYMYSELCGINITRE
jgi:hypothetical protein